MVQQYDELKYKEDRIKGLSSGTVRIGTVSSVSCHLLPDVIKKFWSAYPDVELILHQGYYTSICEWVRTGSVDFGFVNPASAKGLETTILKSDPFVAVLPPDHPLAQKSCISLHDLEKEPYLLLEEGSYSEPLEAFHNAGLSPNIRLTMHDDYSIMSMVEHGLGYSVLAELVSRKTSYNIAIRPLKEPIIRTIALVTKDKRTLPIAAKTFMKFIVDNI